MAEARGLLVKVRGNGKAFAGAAARSFGAAAVEIEPILQVPAQPAGRARGVAAARSATWLRMRTMAPDAANAWDLAHELLAPGGPFAAADGHNIEAVEPDLEQGWLHTDASPDGAMRVARSREELCTVDAQDGDGGKATGPGLAWNLRGDFSGLADARTRVGRKLEKVLIAHLDTGFDPNHVTLPANLRRDLQRNFVKDDGTPDDASDQTPDEMKLVNTRGHGSGTLSLLAGNRLDGTSPGWPGFKDFVGGAPLAQIMPVRIANWVVRLTTGTMVQGFSYAREKGAHVLSMSMGGLPSGAWADAVNAAYEAGVVMVTAAGNNYDGWPTSSIVWPAQFGRVIAACGIMADGSPYFNLPPTVMQGNYGPLSKMATAMAAFTPNIPWPKIGCPDTPVVGFAGDGAFGISMSEMGSIGRKEYPGITMVVFRNYQWGAEKRNTTLWYDDNFVGTELHPELSYAKVAEGCGLKGVAVRTQDELKAAIAESCEAQKKGVTTFIEVILNQELGEPFRRDAMKKPVVVAGIKREDFRPQKV